MSNLREIRYSILKENIGNYCSYCGYGVFIYKAKMEKMKKLLYILILFVGLGFFVPQEGVDKRQQFLAPASNTKEVKDTLYKEKYLKYYSKEPFNWHVFGAHASRVLDIAIIYGKTYGLTDVELNQLKKAAVLHDLCLPENFHLTFPLNDFVKQLPEAERNKIKWYDRGGVFSWQDYNKQMANTINVFEKYGIYDFIRKQKGYKYDVVDGVFLKEELAEIKYKKYTDAELRGAVLDNLSRINQFFTMTGIKYMKEELGIKLTLLEESLIRFHHTAPSNITLKNLKSAFPKEDYFPSTSDSAYHKAIAKLHKNIHKMLPILVLADTTEASNDGFRVDCGFYKRDTETLKFWFSFMKNHLIDSTGELNKDMYDLAFTLVKQRNREFFKALNSARATRIHNQNLLPNKEDDFFIENMDKFSQALFNPVYVGADSTSDKTQTFFKMSA